MDNEQPETPKNVLPDLIIPVLALVFSIYYLTTITEVPWIAQASAIIVSGLLLVFILAFAIRTVVRIRAGTEFLRLERFRGDHKLLIRRLGLLVLTIAYVWFIDIAGFTLTTLSFLFLAIILLSSPANWKRALVVALACAAIGNLVFIFVFATRFPKGPVEHYIEELVDGR